jgi:hypothetical protein
MSSKSSNVGWNGGWVPPYENPNAPKPAPVQPSKKVETSLPPQPKDPERPGGWPTLDD